MRRILHIDMDAFFAAVEQKRHPELVGKPVVIGGDGDPTKRGVVSTASYEARKYGIHSAMPLRTAYRLCPVAIFLPVDYEEYQKVSQEIKDILRDFTPLIEDAGLDEAFLDITDLDITKEFISKAPSPLPSPSRGEGYIITPPLRGGDKGEGEVCGFTDDRIINSEKIAVEIKKKIKNELNLTCSIGIGPNKLLAKIASDMKKPDGLTVISEKDIEKLIWPLSVRKLWGVGPKTESYLKSIGIDTIGKLALQPLEELIKQFGQSYGHYLHEASRGIDNSPVITHWEPKSMSREITFQKDIDNWQIIAKNLAELTEEVVESMKQSDYVCRTITVKIRFSDFKTFTRAKTLDEFTASPDVIRKAAFEALSRIELKKKVRLIGVRVSNLKKVY